MVNKTVNKTVQNVKTKRIKTERRIFSIILLFYIFGICAGCLFVFGSRENAEFTNNVFSYNSAKIIIYFIAAFMLKYSGVLSCGICILPTIIGIQNASYYCSTILYSQDKFSYSIVFNILKDTALTMLFILYILILFTQIINKKYNIKRDVKYLSVYIIGANIIIFTDFIIRRFIV